MNQKQNKRWGLMILSVLSAFLVWLGVVNVADPVMTDTVEVPIEIINDEILTANNLTYEIVGRRTTTISYEVNTTNAYRINASDFRAYADMTQLWDVTGSIPVTIEVLNHSEYLTSNPVSKTATIKIETEPLQRKQFMIQSVTVGDTAAGYEPGEAVLYPGSLYVEGPESLIGQISSVGIEIPLDGATSDLEARAPVLYYDANGNVIELDDRITSDCEDVAYRQTVLRAKEITLDFQVSGEVAPGYRFTGVECDVRSIPVVGLRSALASLNTLVISGDSMNLDGASSNVTRTIDLLDYLPEGVSPAAAAQNEVNVTLTVERLEERTYPVDTGQITYIGKTDDYLYRTVSSTIQIRVRALSEDLDSLTIVPASVVVDLSSLGEGEHTIQPELTLDQAYETMSVSPCVVEVTAVAAEEESDGETSGETTQETSGGTSEAAPDRTENPQDTAGETSAETVAADIPEENG